MDVPATSGEPLSLAALRPRTLWSLVAEVSKVVRGIAGFWCNLPRGKHDAQLRRNFRLKTEFSTMPALGKVVIVAKVLKMARLGRGECAGVTGFGEPQHHRDGSACQGSAKVAISASKSGHRMDAG